MYEAQVKAHEAQRKAAESQLKVEEARRESSLSGRLSSGDGLNRAKSPKLPTFNQDRDDIDAYIHRFERYATSKNWDKETEWAINLGALLQEHATFLRERKPADIKEMAKYTDQYLEAHERWYQGGTKAKTNQQKSTRSQEKSEAKPSPAPSMKTSGSSQMADTSQRRRGSCFICGKRGHFAKDCRQRQSYAVLAEVLTGIIKLDPHLPVSRNCLQLLTKSRKRNFRQRCRRSRPPWREGCADHSMEVDEKASAATVLTRRQAQIESPGLRKLKVSSPIPNVTPDMLSTEQEKDVTLKKCRELAKSSELMESKNGSSHRNVKENGILYRKFQSPKVEFGNVVKQVVVPKCYRDYVMKVAHESILGGHQGSSRTYDKVCSSFIWPGLHADITRYCQSCDVCQRMCPKGRVSKVPLGSTPLLEEPFQRIAVDLVGPIKPSSARGHRYILVIVDYATRYPDAIPLKTIDTGTVAEGLLDVFSRVGIPKEILTDQGTQFVSNLMKEVSRLLPIRRFVTTPYHAMCNGLVEKFNGTIKATLKKMCEEKPQDWHRFISPLPFAYREIPQERTGFSPFELMYGRTVRGPMMILKELWTGSNESKARTSQKKYATYYNRCTRERQLAEGDEVLLLLPTDNNKLLMHWKGRFLVEKKVNAMNYKIYLGKSVKTFHINMLKRYHRAVPSAPQVTTCNANIYLTVGGAVIEDNEDREVIGGCNLTRPGNQRSEQDTSVDHYTNLKKAQISQSYRIRL
ncbi:hypothetical protein HOLleu_07817 [Holothuria leucospilota]|uniref:Polyprotein n=1 Tax=Holothuria leucospilota TaxID=206669 RepID=A0A9Q1HFV7_HOLLE|nr:hypothetical protein HOLleu_07817 [Holothuria leucospilota]